MVDPRKEAFADKIRLFIAETGSWDNTPAELTDDHLLIEEGVLDSLSLMTLVQFLEEECSIMIDDEDILPENFGSIDLICRFLATVPSA
jgi:acyl carrier protein